MSSKLNRIIQMDRLIRSNSYPSVALFQERFEVSERTVHDDVSYFRDTLMAPIKYSRSGGGYHYTDPTWVLPTIITTEGELLAFFLSAELARRYLGTLFEEPLRNAISKLSQNLPGQVDLDPDQLTQHFTFQSGAIASANPDLLVAITTAISECYALDITYYTASRGERNNRLIEPHHLYNVRGDWQVIAFDHRRKDFRNFALSNFEIWTVRKDIKFIRDVDFSPSAYLAGGFLAERGETPVEIEIWFDKQQAHYIRQRTWHRTQSIEEHQDGSLTLRFETGALREVGRWVMSYGSHAQVRTPRSLCCDIATEVFLMRDYYNQFLKFSSNDE
jgi:predicted DNA-binding transcriptional regulator YafY